MLGETCRGHAVAFADYLSQNMRFVVIGASMEAFVSLNCRRTTHLYRVGALCLRRHAGDLASPTRRGSEDESRMASSRVGFV
jgi:hypothetical protein